MRLYTVVVHDHLRLYKYFCIYSVKMTLVPLNVHFHSFSQVLAWVSSTEKNSGGGTKVTSTDNSNRYDIAVYVKDTGP